MSHDFYKNQHATCIQYYDTHVYLYFLMSIPGGLCQPPLIIILFPLNYIVGLFCYSSTSKWAYSMIMATLHSLSLWVPPQAHHIILPGYITSIINFPKLTSLTSKISLIRFLVFFKIKTSILISNPLKPFKLI
jgi:hypothetical protein